MPKKHPQFLPRLFLHQSLPQKADEVQGSSKNNQILKRSSLHSKPPIFRIKCWNSMRSWVLKCQQPRFLCICYLFPASIHSYPHRSCFFLKSFFPAKIYDFLRSWAMFVVWRLYASLLVQIQPVLTYRIHIPQARKLPRTNLGEKQLYRHNVSHIVRQSHTFFFGFPVVSFCLPSCVQLYNLSPPD